MNLTKTRFRPPNRSAGLISRRQLDAITTCIPHKRLVFVKAPAGYGKSSQLQRWHATLAPSDSIVGWLSLDRSIDGLRGLFFNVIASLREHAPDFGEEFLSFLNSSHEPTTERVASAFVNALCDTSQQVILFFDDLHLVIDSDALCVLALILRDAPRNFHVVAASRQSLPFSLARLRMLGEIAEIGVDELKFNADDIGDFLLLSGRQPLPETVINQLLSATEGWAAGIQLATISISQHDGVAHFLDRFTGEHKAVSDYLLDDVVSQLPEPMVEFLLRTSILEVFCEELCDFVAGTTDSGAMIRQLSAQSLFIFSLDDENNWFRYHHLFSELLRRILRKRTPDAIQGLHRRASDWFSRHRDVDLAFSHAVMGEDWSAAGTILEAACSDLFYGGKLATLNKWSNALPEEVRANFPRLQLAVAWSIILQWRFDDAAKIIRDTEDRIARWKSEGACAEHVEKLSMLIVHRKMMLALFSDDMPTVEKYVLELLHAFPCDDPYLRGTLENCLIYARREMFKLDNVDKMDRWGREFFRKSGSRFVMVWHEAILAPTYHLRGDTEMGERALMSAMETAEYVDGACTPLQAMPAMLLAEIKYENNELEEAQSLIDRFRIHADKQGFVDHLAAYYVISAKLLARAGRFEDARKILADGQRAAQFHGFRRLAQRLEYESASVAARSGDVEFLRAVLKRGAAGAEKRRLTPGAHSMSCDEHLVLARQLACCQIANPRDVIAILRQWVRFAADRGAARSEVRFQIALAQCLWISGEEGEALRRIRSAIGTAARPRYLRSFLDGGEPVRLMLHKLFGGASGDDGVVGDFGRELVGAFAREPASVLRDEEIMAPPAARDPEHAPSEGLSRRERDVLRLVAAEKSNKEIARALGMTEGTVKWYMQQVFSKLDVRRRSTAVRRARRFGML